MSKILFTTPPTKESKQDEQQPLIRLLDCPPAISSICGHTDGGGTLQTSLLLCSRPQAASMVCIELLAMSLKVLWPESTNKMHFQKLGGMCEKYLNGTMMLIEIMMENYSIA